MSRSVAALLRACVSSKEQDCRPGYLPAEVLRIPKCPLVSIKPDNQALLVIEDTSRGNFLIGLSGKRTESQVISSSRASALPVRNFPFTSETSESTPVKSLIVKLQAFLPDAFAMDP